MTRMRRLSRGIAARRARGYRRWRSRTDLRKDGALDGRAVERDARERVVARERARRLGPAGLAAEGESLELVDAERLERPANHRELPGSSNRKQQGGAAGGEERVSESRGGNQQGPLGGGERARAPPPTTPSERERERERERDSPRRVSALSRRPRRTTALARSARTATATTMPRQRRRVSPLTAAGNCGRPARRGTAP